MKQMTVSVIGLGLMGAAIARCLVNAGICVTVWNRSKDKAQEFQAQTASPNSVNIAANVLSAIQYSDIIIVCIRDYDASDALLRQQDIEQHLGGKTIIQLSTGTPIKAREAALWATSIKAKYLDGEIMAFPIAVGSQNCPILYAGDAAVYQSCELITKALGDPAQWIAEDPGAAAALGNAGLSIYFGFLFGALNGAAICQAENIPLANLQTLASSLAPFFNDVLTRTVKMIDADDYQSTHSTLDTSAGALTQIAEIIKNANLDGRFVECLQGYAKEGIEEGNGSVSNAVLFKQFTSESTSLASSEDK